MPSKLIRWIPAFIAPVVVAGAVAVPLTAAAAPNLPEKTPEQVLALVAKAKSLEGFSGTVSQRSALGLPEIPSVGAGSDSDTGSALEALTGDHTARVWVAGTSKSRIAVLDSTGERDVVRNGSTVWSWDSDAQRATRVTVEGAPTQAPKASAETPQQAADEVLKLAGPTTTTSVDSAQRVAGRSAYTLVLVPKTADTTIGSIRLAVDSGTGLPLRVQAFARGADAPAFEVGFTSVDLSAPDAAVFDFTPPSGATVQKKTVDASALRDHARSSKASGTRPTVTGEGWSSVVEYADAPASLRSNPTVQRLTTAADGGRVLSTALVNVLLTDDGRVLAGAVPVSRLTDVAR